MHHFGAYGEISRSRPRLEKFKSDRLLGFAVFVAGQADPLDDGTQKDFPKDKNAELLPPSARPQPM